MVFQGESGRAKDLVARRGYKISWSLEQEGWQRTSLAIVGKGSRARLPWRATSFASYCKGRELLPKPSFTSSFLPKPNFLFKL